jgi:hypothetical protein
MLNSSYSPYLYAKTKKVSNPDLDKSKQGVTLIPHEPQIYNSTDLITFFTFKKSNMQGLDINTVVPHFPSMQETLGSTSITTKTKA